MTASRHSLAVSQWIDRALKDRASAEIVPLFGHALLAIWNRAHITLGEVSLRAITQRILHAARPKFPVLAALRIDATADSFRALTTRDGKGIDRAELIAAVEFVLTELLVLLGALTAEILSNGLHEALAAVGASTPSKVSS